MHAPNGKSHIFLVNFLIGGLLFGCVSYNGDKQSAPSGIEISTLKNHVGEDTVDPLPIVKLTLNNIEGVFLLDTGSSHTVFTPDFAKKLGLPAIGNVTGQDSGGEIVNGSVLPPMEFRSPGLIQDVRISQPIALDIGLNLPGNPGGHLVWVMQP